MPFEVLCSRFIQQLEERNRIKLLPWDEARWFRGAYSTVQRTLRGDFSPLTRPQKSSLTELLFGEIPRIAGRNFDKRLKHLIERLVPEFSISIGHAQKLISILLKYAVVCHHCHPGSIPNAWTNLIEAHVGHLPVPIDAIVLYRLANLFPKQFGHVCAGSGRDKRGRPTYWATVTSGAKSEAWSRVSTIKTYWSLQERIRLLAASRGCTPLEFEMKNLWVTA